MEGLAGEGTALARLTFDFLRPVPIAPLALRAEVTRAGAKVLRLQAALVAPDGTPCVQASAVALRTTPALPEALGDLEPRSEEHTSELQSRLHLVCRLLLEKKKTKTNRNAMQTSSSSSS